MSDEADETFDRADYPLRVTFGFRNAEERDEFLGQLSDGWGETGCYLDWDGAAESIVSTDFIGAIPIYYDEAGHG